MATTLSLKDPQAERRGFINRVAVLFGIALVLIGVLIVRLLQLQVWGYETHQTRSEDNRIQVQPLAPNRGLIYARNGVLLAENRPVSSLAVVRELVLDLPARSPGSPTVRRLPALQLRTAPRLSAVTTKFHSTDRLLARPCNSFDVMPPRLEALLVARPRDL